MNGDAKGDEMYRCGFAPAYKDWDEDDGDIRIISPDTDWHKSKELVWSIEARDYYLEQLKKDPNVLMVVSSKSQVNGVWGIAPIYARKPMSKGERTGFHPARAGAYPDYVWEGMGWSKVSPTMKDGDSPSQARFITEILYYNPNPVPIDMKPYLLTPFARVGGEKRLTKKERKIEAEKKKELKKTVSVQKRREIQADTIPEYNAGFSGSNRLAFVLTAYRYHLYTLCAEMPIDEAIKAIEEREGEKIKSQKLYDRLYDHIKRFRAGFMAANEFPDEEYRKRIHVQSAVRYNIAEAVKCHIEEFRSWFVDNDWRGINCVVSPMGYGKSGSALRVALKGQKIIIACDTRALSKSLFEEAQGLGLVVDRVLTDAEAHTFNPKADVIITTSAKLLMGGKQTAEMQEMIKDAVVFIDECQENCKKAWKIESLCKLGRTAKAVVFMSANNIAGTMPDGCNIHEYEAIEKPKLYVAVCESIPNPEAKFQRQPSWEYMKGIWFVQSKKILGQIPNSFYSEADDVVSMVEGCKTPIEYVKWCLKNGIPQAISSAAAAGLNFEEARFPVIHCYFPTSGFIDYTFSQMAGRFRPKNGKLFCKMITVSCRAEIDMNVVKIFSNPRFSRRFDTDYSMTESECLGLAIGELRRNFEVIILDRRPKVKQSDVSSEPEDRFAKEIRLMEKEAGISCAEHKLFLTDEERYWNAARKMYDYTRWMEKKLQYLKDGLRKTCQKEDNPEEIDWAYRMYRLMCEIPPMATDDLIVGADTLLADFNDMTTEDEEARIAADYKYYGSMPKMKSRKKGIITVGSAQVAAEFEASHNRLIAYHKKLNGEKNRTSTAEVAVGYKDFRYSIYSINEKRWLVKDCDKEEFVKTNPAAVLLEKHKTKCKDDRGSWQRLENKRYADLFEPKMLINVNSVDSVDKFEPFYCGMSASLLRLP
jgi:hypothetical protein